jgi:hypothetical protein
VCLLRDDYPRGFKLKKLILAMSAASLAGCASMQPTYQTESTFVIYDVQPASVDRTRLLNAVLEAVQKHSSQVRVNRDIPPAVLPETPGRFELKDPFGGTKMGALLATQAQNVRVPVCKDALMTLASDSTSMAQYGERTSFFVCVLPYKSGYQIDVYATFVKASGGMTPQALGSAAARSLIGDSSQFIPRAMNDLHLAAESVGGQVTVVDSYIPEAFKGAFVNQAGSASK